MTLVVLCQPFSAEPPKPWRCLHSQVKKCPSVFGFTGSFMLNTCSPSSYAETNTYGHRTSWLCASVRQSDVHALIGTSMFCVLPVCPGCRSQMRSGVYWYSVSVTAYLPSGDGVNVCARS